MADVNRGYMLIGAEATYGAGQLAGASLLKRTWNVNMEKQNDAIETGNLRTGLPEELNDMKRGLGRGVVTVEGRVGIDDEILLKAMFLDSSLDGTEGDEYKIQETQGTAYSFAIYKYKPDLGATKYDVAEGCVLESIQFSGTTGDLISFTATFRSLEPEFAKTPSFSGDLPTDGTGCMNFVNLEFSKDSTGSLSIASFDLTVTNEFTSDENTYQNSNVKPLEIAIKSTAVLTTNAVKINADDTFENAGFVEDALTDVQLVWNEDGGVSSDNWTIDMYVKHMTGSRNNDGNDVLQQTFEMRGFQDTANSYEPIEVTVNKA
jgi:hypothetical protein